MTHIFGVIHEDVGFEPYRLHAAAMPKDVGHIYIEFPERTEGRSYHTRDMAGSPFMQTAADPFPGVYDKRTIDGTFVDEAIGGALLRSQYGAANTSIGEAAEALLRGKDVLSRRVWNVGRSAVVDAIKIFASITDLREKRMATQVYFSEMVRSDTDDSVVVVGSSHADPVAQHLLNHHDMSAELVYATPDWHIGSVQLSSVVCRDFLAKLTPRSDVGVESYLAADALVRALIGIRRIDHYMKKETPLPDDLDILGLQGVDYAEELYGALTRIKTSLFGRHVVPYGDIVAMAVDLAKSN